MPVVIPTDIKTKDQIVLVEEKGTSNCTSTGGHCFGSDGGSPTKTTDEGRGGEQEVWTIDISGTKINKKEIYIRCQYCQKHQYSHEKTE